VSDDNITWTEVSEVSRQWLKTIGDFGPTVHAKSRELKGYLHAEEGEDGRTYIDANELRELAAACVEAADWLDKRAALAEGVK